MNSQPYPQLPREAPGLFPLLWVWACLYEMRWRLIAERSRVVIISEDPSSYKVHLLGTQVTPRQRGPPSEPRGGGGRCLVVTGEDPGKGWVWTVPAN